MVENRSRRRSFKTPVAGVVYGLKNTDSDIAYPLLVENDGQLKTRDYALDKARTIFGRIGTAEATPQIELNSVYGFSKLRDINQSENGGAIIRGESEFILSSGTDSNGKVDLSTSEIGRYIPGAGCEIGIGVRLDSDGYPSNGTKFMWGGFSTRESDGIYFGVDSGGYFVGTRRDNVDDFISRDSWNIDRLDGFGPSEYVLNDSDGHIFQLDFSWYGYGKIQWSVVATNQYGIQAPIPVHEKSSFNRTSIRTANLKIKAMIENNGNPVDYRGYIAGRQYSIIGRYLPNFRFTAERNQGISTNNTTAVPIISFKRKPGEDSKTLRIDGYEVIVSGSAHYIQIYANTSLTNDSFSDPRDADPAETSLLSDYSATSLDSGLLIYQFLVPASVGNQIQFSDKTIDYDVPSNQVLTMAAKSVNATGTVTAAVLRLKEDW